MENIAEENQNLLFQNSPNPFSDKTMIRFYLEPEVKNAQVVIYNLTGMQLKAIPIKHFGESSIEISAGEFKAGMYIYCLIVNGELVDTKQMILTEKK